MVDPRIDVARIAFLTRRFHELQGLGTAVYGCGLVFAVLLNHVTGAMSTFRPPPSQALTVANMVGLVAMLQVPRLYRQTFGDPVPAPRSRVLGALLILGVMAGGLVDLAVQLQGGEGPSIMAVVLALYAIWIVARDGTWRIHYLVAAAAGLMGALITAGVPAMATSWGRVAPHREEAYLLCYTLVGLTLVVVGLLDHRLLASSLAVRPAGVEAPPAIARTANGLTRAIVGAFFCVAAGGTLAAVDAALIGPVLSLAFSLAYLGTIFALVVVPKWTTIRQAAHQLVSLQREPGVPVVQHSWQVGTDSLALMGIIALAGAIDAWILPSGVPSVAGLSIAFASAWVAIRDWRYRPYYLVGAMAALVASLLGAGMPPAKSFTVLVLAVSGSLVVEGLLDYLVAARHASRANLPGSPEPTP